MIVICYSKKLVDKKNEQVKFDFIQKINEEYISVTYGCVRFIDSYRFQSSSLDSIAKTVVDNSNKTLKDLGEEIVDNDYILKIVTDIGKYKRTIKGLKKDYRDKINEL